MKKLDKSVEILGVTITGTQWSRVLTKLGLQRKEMLHIATVNPEYVMEARRNQQFKDILAQSLTVADGYGVVWAAGLLGAGKLERISGIELAEEILKRANERGEKVFFLGAKPGVAEQAAERIGRQYPGAKLAWYEGARSVAVEKGEEASMTIAKINAYEPDYLFVAYGSPWQDIWIEGNRPYLRVRVAMGVGGVLDEWAGTVAVAPRWIDAVGLKWLWRLVHEPWRWRRILRVFEFGSIVIYKSIVK